MSERLGGWVALTARLLLGGVLLAAGLLKLPDPAEGVRAVRAFRLLPEPVVPAVGYGLPVLEIALGALLVLGTAVRLAAVLTAVLLAAFVVGILGAWLRGLAIDCGCFGGGGAVAANQTRYGTETARDLALLTVALGLARWPSSRRALSPAPSSMEGRP
jgi:uncharacterized membrane protein YphA (DoxX/SURF4 family)